MLWNPTFALYYSIRHDSVHGTWVDGMKRLECPCYLGPDHLPSFSVIVVLTRHKHFAALKMFSNRIMVIGAGLLGYAASLGIPRMESNFFGAEHIQPRFSSFQPNQIDLWRRDGTCGPDRHPCKCSCTADETPSTRTGLLTNT